MSRAKTGSGPRIREYLIEWLVQRRERGLDSVRNDEASFRRYVLPTFGRRRLAPGLIRPREIQDWLRRMMRTTGVHGRPLAPRTIRTLYGLVHRFFEDAVADELIDISPCRLHRGDLPEKVDVDPCWRATAVFSRDEVEALLSDPTIPEDRCVLYTLAACGGMRFGEICALRWHHYDAAAVPLGRLFVHRSYSVHRHIEKGVKTGRPRMVPVHPVLAEVLASWRDYGWARMMERPPNSDDLIIPSREGRNRSVRLGLRRFHADLERLGLRSRRLHDLRRTFISLCLSGGARKDVLRWVSHGAAGDVMDLYTSLPWPALCEAVLALQLSAYATRVHRQLLLFTT